MPFAPGQSGNPGGRSKENARIRALASSHAESAIRKLVKIMEESQDEETVIRAAQALLDRGLGKPATVIIGGDEDDPAVKIANIALTNLS